MNPEFQKHLILLGIFLIGPWVIQFIVRPRKNRRLWLLVTNVVFYITLIKISNPAVTVVTVLIVIGLGAITVILHELGHVVVLKLFGVRIIKTQMIPLVAFAVLSSEKDRKKLLPGDLILVSLAGCAVNVALASFYNFEAVWGWYGYVFVLVNMAAHGSNIIPAIFTDGTNAVLEIYRSTTSKLLSFFRMNLIVGVMLPIFLPPGAALFGILVTCFMLALNAGVLWARKEVKSKWFEMFQAEVLFSVYLGVGIIYLYNVFYPMVINTLTHFGYWNWVIFFTNYRFSW